MPLKVKLAQGECLFVNGATLTNVGSTATLLVGYPARIIRGRQVIRETDEDSWIDRLYLAVQDVLMSAGSSEQPALEERLAEARFHIGPDDFDEHAALEDVRRLIDEKDYYKALRRLRPLMAEQQATPLG